MDKEYNRNKSIVKLGFWLAFIIVIVIIVKFDNKDVNNNQDVFVGSKEEIKYEDKLANLKDNYEYEYEINIDGIIYYFNGKKMASKEVGEKSYLENENEIQINYFIENNNIYEVIDQNLKEINNLYDNINKDYLNIEYIKSLINNSEYSLENNIYSYNIDNIIINISADNENIQEIDILDNNDNYKLKFTEINMIKDVNY